MARRRSILTMVTCFVAVAAPVLASPRVGPAPPGAGKFGPADTGVITVSDEPGVSQGEEPLSVNPMNPDELLTVANVFQPVIPAPLSMYFGGSGMQDSRLYVSRDGGQHWTTLKLDQGGVGKVALPLSSGNAPEFSDLFNVLNTDADAAWDRHGNAYFESGDVHGIHHNGDEVETVWHSNDAGRTWGPKDGYTAVDATLDEHTELDRPWLAVDNSGDMHDGRLYTTYETTPFAPIPPQVWIKHSDDHGQTWSPSVRVDDGVYETQWNPRARPVVDAAGDVFVVYDRAPISATPFFAYDGAIRLVVAISRDGGTTFRRVLIDRDVLRVTSPDEATPQYTEMIPTIAADPRRAGHVAVAWPQAFGANNSRIELRYTVDGGAHWSKRVDVADDPGSKADQHDHVTLAYLDDGRLFVGWRDRRFDGGTWSSSYDEWVRALSFRGGGVVPGTTVRFTVASQPPTDNGRSPLQPDEFQGLAATTAGIDLTWSQLGEDGLDHLVFRRVPLSAWG